MPARINGIGTTYLGKRDAQTQQGVCESCGRAGPLLSYETRLWFSFVFIPVIPLARRQILNYCPSCTRHRAMSVDEWRKVQTEAIGSAMASVDANPDSPEHAVECHSTLAACGKPQEAGQYAETMINSFGDNADVLMYLGAWYERTGQSARADSCFDRALKVDPQHPGALRAAAVGLVQQNKPREAEEKLATLKPPSKHYDPSLFFALAQAYQTTGDHESALRLMKLVTEATPAVANEKKFRKAVQQSEAALGQHGSVLAPLAWYKRPGIMWPALAAIVLAVIIGFDRYFARNRELFVVNGLSKPIKVRLDGGEPVAVPSQGRLKLTTAEGPHTMSVVEPVALARDEQFTIEGGAMARWRGRQVNVVDPTRSAIVVWEESVYAADARDQRGDFRLHAGEPFLSLDDIDYKFQEFPNQIEVKNSAKTITKHRVGMENLSPMELLLAAPDALAGERRLDFLESHLAASDSRRALLPYYWHAAVQQNQVARCRDYLKRSLGDRPVDIEWHRAYQTVAELADPHAQLATEYDAMLVKEPANADFLYLRGRIEPFGADSVRFYDAALRNEPGHSFTLSAKSYRLSSAGQFDEALPAIEKAIETDPQRGELSDVRCHLLQSLGRHDQVVEELKQKLQSATEARWGHYPDLIEALAYQGNIAEANKMLTEFVETIDREWPQDPMQLKLKSRLVVLLAEKKYAELRAAAAELTDPEVRATWVFASHLSAGEPQEAGVALEAWSALARGYTSLCVGIAWRNAHDEKSSQDWLKRAVDALAIGRREDQIVAQWLKEPPADVSQLLPKIADLSLDPNDKVVVLLALAGNGRQGGQQLLALAERLNAWQTGNQAFVEATLAAMR